MCNYINGTVTNGTYFVYKGVRYGQGTIILFTEEFYQRNGLCCTGTSSYKYPYFKMFCAIEHNTDNEVWKLSNPNFWTFNAKEYINIDPERDIEKIITPVWYYEPRELVLSRLKDGTWFGYVWQQTLFYAACLIISPLFKEWYLIWTIGLYVYIRLCYIALSKGELNRGW